MVAAETLLWFMVPSIPFRQLLILPWTKKLTYPWRPPRDARTWVVIYQPLVIYLRCLERALPTVCRVADLALALAAAWAPGRAVSVATGALRSAASDQVCITRVLIDRWQARPGLQVWRGGGHSSLLPALQPFGQGDEHRKDRAFPTPSGLLLRRYGEAREPGAPGLLLRCVLYPPQERRPRLAIQGSIWDTSVSGTMPVRPSVQRSNRS